MRAITASSLGRVVTCPASAVLPAVFDPSSASATRGTDLHRYLYRALKVGPAAALQEMPAEIRDECAAVQLDQLKPYLPDGVEVMGELALALDVAEERARIIGENVNREYGEPAPGTVYMSTDLITRSAERMVVLDFKTGDHPVPPPGRNWQMIVAALAVRSLHGRAPLMVVAYLRRDGSFYFDEHMPSTMELDTWIEELQSALEQAAAAEATMQAGRIPDVRRSDEGCRFCPCRRSCPAHVSVALALRDDGNLDRPRVAELVPAEAARVWEWLETAERITKAVREGLEVYAMHTPIPLPDGRVLQPVTTQRESIDATVAYRVLCDAYDQQTAQACITPTVTKAGITKALKRDAKRAVEAIRQAGGVTVKEYVDIKAVKA